MFDIYGKPSCRYCYSAKEFLDSKEIQYTYTDISEDLEALEWILSKGFRTVPQIYLGDKHIGGYEDLVKFINQKEE